MAIIIALLTKTLKILGFVINSSKCFINKNNKVKLYYALVRPYLEYVALVWFTEVNINLIESIQRNLQDSTITKSLKILCA